MSLSFAANPITEDANSLLKLKITVCIAEIDNILGNQLNKILHHPLFQRLEATWLSLKYLINSVVQHDKTKVRILSLTLKELQNDVDYALEFDQSQLFKKIYSNEFDHPGGEPFGLLIGDFYLSHLRTSNNLGLDTVNNLGKIAAAAFCPFITSASAELFELDAFSYLNSSMDLAHPFKTTNFSRWRAFRAQEDNRFIGVTLPKVLMRLPYKDSNFYIKGFQFTETTITSSDYLWGSAAYCFAANVSRAFYQSGWFTEIVGIERDKHSKGIVTDLPKVTYFNGCYDINSKSVLETNLTAAQESSLAKEGFIGLSDCKFSDNTVFYSCQSIHQPPLYNKEIAYQNSQLGIKIDYILCVSRFAHYIKVIMRDKIGTFRTANECEAFLQRWLIQYSAVIDDMSPEDKARYPLREAKVSVKEMMGKPGIYQCIIQLKPYFQLDDIESSLQLITEIIN